MIDLHVPSMTCGGCVRAITRAVEAVDPGARVDADLATRHVRVTPATGSAAAFEAALRQAGYPATASVAAPAPAPARAPRKAGGCGCGCAPRVVAAPRAGCCT